MCRSLLLLPGLAACAPVEQTFVGAVDDTDAQVGVVVRDGAATGYVCGGTDTRTTLTRWFEGEGEPEGGELTADDWTLTWGLEAGTLIAPTGTTYTWQVDDQTGTAGLYAAADSGCRDGAVVWDVGGSPALQGTWGCYGAETPMLEVTPVGTLQLADTIEATVAAPEGDHPFTLTRVTPE